MSTLRLYSYWRSSAAYRVRIALNLKQLPHEVVPVDLLKDGGEQHSEAYRRLNPQGLVPLLLHGSRAIGQSLAIIEYLDETWPDRPLLPTTVRERARVRALAQAIACDIHPLNNLRVLRFFKDEWQVPQSERDGWVEHWIRTGFATLETLLAESPSTGVFCEGERPGLADCCLVPQVYNARRFNVDLAAFPTIARIDAACRARPEFDAARPERQIDAPDPA
ncbi:MAG TPA: maleylacetoacetate isomerase [Xanthomonadales bacterium]|nr:maleylacetoacetate isomerase [Xanthomonadales bacterium]